MISHLELILRLFLGALLGGLIGFERERRSWAAGLRTHMLVSVAATLIMLVSMFGFHDVLNVNHVSLDPSRVAAQVVSGIGFLGAGAILLRGEIVRGLTTAASLWSVAAIGLAVGGGLYVGSIAATVIVLVILAGLKPFERHFMAVRQRRQISMLVDRGTLTLPTLHRTLGLDSSKVSQFVAQPSEEQVEFDRIYITLFHMSDFEYQAICRKLRLMPSVHGFQEEKEMG